MEFDNDSVTTYINFLMRSLFQKKIKDESDKVEAERILLAEKLDEMDNSDFWNEFDPIVKERIYYFIQDKDCNGLL